MPGASEQTRRVKIVNANWAADQDGDHGRFEVMMVTEDDQTYVDVDRRGSVHGDQQRPAGLLTSARCTQLPQRLFQTETCAVLAAVNAERSQPAQRYFSSNPVMRAMRSSSAGQAYRNGMRRNRPLPSADTVTWFDVNCWVTMSY